MAEREFAELERMVAALSARVAALESVLNVSGAMRRRLCPDVGNLDGDRLDPNARGQGAIGGGDATVVVAKDITTKAGSDYTLAAKKIDVASSIDTLIKAGAKRELKGSRILQN